MKRAVIFAHYDRDNWVDEYVYYYLMRLKGITNHLVFVTTADLSAEAINRLEKLCYKVMLRDNLGYDFMSYKCALECIDYSQFDEIVFCNDSVYGPFYSLDGIFEVMSRMRCSVWSVTQSRELANHLQSYFLVFRRDVLSSTCFNEFWESVAVLGSKKHIVDRYEVGLSRVLASRGFTTKSFVAYKPSWKDYFSEYIASGIRLSYLGFIGQLVSILKIILKGGIGKCNVTHLFWKEIILKYRMPFIKVDLLRDNYHELPNIREYKSVIKRTGSSYPVDLIEKHLCRMNTCCNHSQ